MTGDCVGMFISLEPISPGKIAVVDPIESRRLRRAVITGPDAVSLWCSGGHSTTTYCPRSLRQLTVRRRSKSETEVYAGGESARISAPLKYSTMLVSPVRVTIFQSACSAVPGATIKMDRETICFTSPLQKKG